jgi:hypothetical protein
MTINETSRVGEGPAQPTAPAGPPPPSNERRQLAGLAAGGVLVGAMVVVALMSGQQSEMRGATGSEPSGARTSRATGAAGRTAGGATANDSTAAIKWTATDDRTGRNRVVSFELVAENEIGLTDRRVRPTLVLRCAPRSLDAFIVTGGAAAIENDAHLHTVRIAFDAAAEAQERWLDSEERDALFAPDGTAFARQLVGRQAMSFTFSPFGAPEATTEFDLHGLDAMLVHMPKSCKW